MREARAYTAAECREMFLDQMRSYVDYWKKQARSGHDDPFGGLAFSFLVMIDGESGDLPAFRILTDPHPDDEASLRAEGSNWWPAGADITEDVALHEMWHAE